MILTRFEDYINDLEVKDFSVINDYNVLEIAKVMSDRFQDEFNLTMEDAENKLDMSSYTLSLVFGCSLRQAQADEQRVIRTFREMLIETVQNIEDKLEVNEMESAKPCSIHQFKQARELVQ